MAAGLGPFVMALRANRGTSLLYAVIWALIAWIGWGVVFLAGDLDHTAMEPARYCALCLTGCAGIAVLGARRPHVFAWNFVVLGLLSVMLLPLVETWFIGTRSFDGLRIAFLAATLAITGVNYLPTRSGIAALAMLILSAGELVLLYAPEWISGFEAQMVLDAAITMLPWLAYFRWRRTKSLSEADTLWLDFRDGWGLVWGQRVRDQFNSAAENAKLPVRLAWSGIENESDLTVDQAKVLATMRAVLQRFIEAP
jgi:hypothetical protein